MPMMHKISGKQVNLLLAKFINIGVRSTQQQLEFIEQECGIEIYKLEDINTGQIDLVLRAIKERE